MSRAAGITKFKAKKKAAERKMDQTRQNLLRVGDIDGDTLDDLCVTSPPAGTGARPRRRHAGHG